jgi:hypothetical protein
MKSKWFLWMGIMTFPFCIKVKAQNSAKDIVSLRVVNVLSGGLRSTGFFWKNSNWIVTTLHSIGNSSDVELAYHDGVPHHASVIRVLKKADLVLLQSDENISNEKFQVQTFYLPAVDTRLFTVGYYLDHSGFQSIDLTVGLLEKTSREGDAGITNGNTLGDILDFQLQSAVARLGFPNLAAKIIFLSGQILHGYSGAPVVDRDGNLVGIADGGLENGAAGISWCVTSDYLSQLENSPDQFPSGNQQINILFAADIGKDLGVDVPLGEFNFKKIRTMSFRQIDLTAQYSSTESLGLRQLLTYFSNLNVPYADFRFDVYTEEHSGYTILVPAGRELTEENGDLTVRDAENNLAMVYHISTSENIQQSFWDYENSIMQGFGQGQGPSWVNYPAFSYPYPIKGKFARAQRLTYVNNGLQQQYVQTISDKGKYFTASSAFANHFLSTGTSTPDQINTWITFVLAAELTSFSN